MLASSTDAGDRTNPVGVGALTPTESTPFPCEILQIDHYRAAAPAPALPDGFVSLEDLLAEVAAEPAAQPLLEDAQRWLGETLQAEEGVTLRTLRLRRGLSQAQLAAMLGMQQPNVARMERGQDNMVLATCRRLAEALGVDLNTLDAAVRQQQSLRAAP